MCVCWPTVFEDNPTVPFSIATTPRCKGWYNSFHCITPHSLNPYLIMLSFKQGGIKYHFLNIWYDLT